MLISWMAAALFAAAPMSAEAVLERAEQALLKPPRLSLKVRIRAEGSFDADIVTGWRWAPKSKLRIDIDGRLLRAPSAARFVSTGQYMQWPGNLVPVAPDLDRGSRLMVFRLGASFNAIRIASGTLPDGLDGTGQHFARVTKVRLGKAEKVGHRKTLPLRFTMLVADEQIGTATLWVDAKTYLPVKRRMTVAFNGGRMDVEETYLRLRQPRSFPKGTFSLY